MRRQAIAGLPAKVHDLLSDRILTFLRRADQHHLGPVHDDDVAQALEGPIHRTGRSIDEAALQLAVEGPRGYPFLIQLVGHWVYGAAPDEPVISAAQAGLGVAAARRRIGEFVHQPSLMELSAIDRTFLAAMAQDDGPSNMSELTARLQVSPDYASQYRLRLIAAGMIGAPTRGSVDFALPYLREYLRDHATTLGI